MDPTLLGSAALAICAVALIGLWRRRSGVSTDGPDHVRPATYRPVTVVPRTTRAGKGPAPQGQGKPPIQLPKPVVQVRGAKSAPVAKPAAPAKASAAPAPVKVAPAKAPGAVPKPARKHR